MFFKENLHRDKSLEPMLHKKRKKNIVKNVVMHNAYEIIKPTALKKGFC